MKRRHAIVAVCGLLAGCAHRHPVTIRTASLAPLADDVAPHVAAPTTTSTTETPTTTETPQPVYVAPTPTTPVPAARGAILSVTAYCQSGTMADGNQTHPGAAAGNRWPFGTRLNIAGYGTVTIEDRIGYGSDLDIYMPSCAQAVAWGRQAREVSAA